MNRNNLLLRYVVRLEYLHLSGVESSNSIAFQQRSKTCAYRYHGVQLSMKTRQTSRDYYTEEFKGPLN